MPSPLPTSRPPLVRPGFVLALWGMLAAGAVVYGQEKQPEGDTDKPLPTVAERTRDLERRDGFLPLWIDERGGKVWLELPPPGADRGVVEAIYVEGLTRGLGSNPVGLDRGQLQDAKLLRIRRIGPAVLFEQPNLNYRALDAPAAEQRAAAESFATSVLWSGKIAALDQDGRSLVDLTSFLLRDSHGVAATLERSGQGSFSFDRERSIVDLDAALAFPDNLELEVILTWSGAKPGELVRQTAPTPDAVSLVAHHSLVRPPPQGYRPRALDPRIGMFGISFLDYAAPLDQPVRKRWIARHRLEKQDPGAERSPAVEPIVYYVDAGVPEPVRSALVEGASWWAEAFAAAGFIDGYRVDILPADAHPLDVRYNVIQWVHRSTRGWSYGNGISDPRSGEIIKGHVNLGSLRVRQDRLLFEGLAGTAKTGSGAPDDPVELALARIRQLAAHEVGHSLGITHNFAASTYGGRASVMDYPAPLVGIGPDGELDFSDAYAVGLGEWDLHTIRYGYSQPPPDADENAFLAGVVRDGLDRGLLFLSDDDARPLGASDARANLWDNGSDPVAELEHVLAVRRLALDRFGEGNVRQGQPLAELEEVLAPLYFHHRYQLEATAKMVGGLTYDYAVRGDGQTATEIVPAERQRAALAAVLGVLDPQTLDLPERVLALLAPRPFGWEPSIETFAGSAAPAFDPLAAAATAADQVATLLTVPERLARLTDQHRRFPAQPSATEVLEALVDATFADRGEGSRAGSGRLAAVRSATRRAVAERLIARGSEEKTPADLRAFYDRALDRMSQGLASSAAADGDERARAEALREDIARFRNRAYARPPAAAPAADPPPGSPIGQPDALGACSQGSP